MGWALRDCAIASDLFMRCRCAAAANAQRERAQLRQSTDRRRSAIAVDWACAGLRAERCAQPLIQLAHCTPPLVPLVPLHPAAGTPATLVFGSGLERILACAPAAAGKTLLQRKLAYETDCPTRTAQASRAHTCMCVRVRAFGSVHVSVRVRMYHERAQAHALSLACLLC